MVSPSKRSETAKDTIKWLVTVRSLEDTKMATITSIFPPIIAMLRRTREITDRMTYASWNFW